MQARIRTEINAQGVADVALTRSDKMNALDEDMFDALVSTIDNLSRATGLRAVVIHGEGKSFCAGLDMGRFKGMASGANNAQDRLGPRTHGIANKAQQVAIGWRGLAVPVIAAVHGVAFGGGLQLALGADVRLVAPDTQMSVMELKWGLVPDMAGMVLMRGLVREDHLRELIYSARIVGAVEAVALGLATRVCDDPLTAAHEMANAIAQRSPNAIRSAKRLVNQASRTLDDSAGALLQAESDEQIKLIGSPQQIEAVRANMEKRSPLF